MTDHDICIAFIESLACDKSVPGQAQVLSLLDSPCALGVGKEFQGRPSTRLYADAGYVLKLKTPYSLSPDSAAGWCRSTLAKERAYGIYLPERCWLVLRRGDECAVANVSPRRQTLEVALTECRDAGQSERFFSLLSRYLKRYFDFWQAHGLRQDEGATNYVVVGDEVFYVDDDIYNQDDLISFAHGLGNILRKIGLFDEQLALRVGQELKQRLDAIDPIMPFSLSEHLSDVFLGAARKPQMAALRDGLRGIERSVTVAVAPQVDASAAPSGRVALLGDIHGNLPALQAVLADLQREGIEQAIVLGDIVGYGPNPGECIAALRDKPWIFVRGNHDHAMYLGEANERFSRSARLSILWTLQQLSAADRRWLGELPFNWHGDGIYALHAAPADASFMNAYVYHSTAEHNLDKLAERHMWLCFHGHSHIQGAWYRDQQDLLCFGKPSSLTAAGKGPFLVCPGSVGLPRDGCNLAQYAIYDSSSRTMTFKQVEFDRARLLESAQAVGLPDTLLKLFELR